MDKRYATNYTLDCAATRTGSQQSPTHEQFMLARSLACYCSNDDIAMTRGEFLQMVVDRIASDINTGEY